MIQPDGTISIDAITWARGFASLSEDLLSLEDPALRTVLKVILNVARQVEAEEINGYDGLEQVCWALSDAMEVVA